jgi:tetratricopeptide (TPR) repeat protein
MEKSYQEAVKFFENKDYQSTIYILLDLKEKYNNPDVLYFLAVVKSIMGDYNGAEPLFKEVIQNKPKDTEANYNLALCLHNQNKTEEALIYYQKAVELNPFLSEAYNNIAIIYKDMGKYDEAEAAFKKAVKVRPDNMNAMSNLSDLKLSQDSSSEYREALEFYNKREFSAAKDILLKLLGNKPGSVDLLNSLGIVLFKLEEYKDAAEYFDKVISFNCNIAEAHYNSGVCRQHLMDNAKALEEYKKAIELKPDYVEAFNNLGLIYKNLKNYDEAERCYRQVLKYDPEHCQGIINLGGIKLDTDYFNEALDYFNRAISLLLRDNKNNGFLSVAYTNVGVVNYRGRNINEAVKYFTKAIELNNNNFIAHYNKAEVLLISGQYEEGWREYEWRVERKEFGKRKCKISFTREHDLRGKRILVYAEQGLGDAIQFIRYLPMLKEKGCYIIFECMKELHNMLPSGYYDEIIERNTDEVPDIKYDYEVPLLSLPLYFNTEINTIPVKFPYLKVNESTKKKWSGILNSDDQIKVGVVWAGSPKHFNDRHRSVRLSRFMSLLSVKGIRLYSIQRGFPSIQAKDYQLLITDLNDGMKNFEDLAAVVDNLDLIITVDTSAAHLAGALGKETWLLLSYLADWRWLLDTSTSPWYPTIKLYRQTILDDWDQVFSRLKKDLISFVEQKKGIQSRSKLDKINLNTSTLYTNLPSGENFGWGVVSKYFKKELSQKLEVINLDEHEEIVKTGKVDGTVFHILNNTDFNGLYRVRGIRNIGHAVFEYELNDLAIKNARRYDIILAASSWNLQRLNGRVTKNTGLLIQGVDPEIFYPGEKEKKNDLFVIFSGGKFELRKGQDLILKAVQILQQKYSDIVLINAWYNIWPQTMQSMAISKYINYEFKGETWKNFMINLCRINNIDGNKVFTLPLTPNNKLRELYLNSDIGLFPNRCEGGTNLVMMEYMSCGRPVIASYTSGHKDVLTDENSLPLKNLKEFKLFDNKKLLADWEEPDIDEIIAKIEYAYFNRDKIKQIGKNAGEFMKKFTWEKSAETLLKYIF